MPPTIVTIRHREVTAAQMNKAIAAVRKALRDGQAAAYAGDFTAAYGAFEEAQHLAFDLKGLFGLDVDEAADPPPAGITGRCTASSWQSKSQRPYGPGGFNRCTHAAAEPHVTHLDEFGNVFTVNPDAAGGSTDPRVKILGHAEPGEWTDGGT